MLDPRLTRLIGNAFVYGVEDLSLQQAGLDSLPADLDSLDLLQTLDLSQNRLEELPPQLGTAVRLRKLDLSKNRLAELPEVMRGLACLVELYLADNRIEKLPAWLSSLESLERLDLARNLLSRLPPEVGRLTRLVTLHLAGNRLTDLPKTLNGLENLTELDLSRNGITRLPASLSQLSRLRGLDLHGNALEAVPADVGRLTGLASLDLGDNRISELPVEIAGLRDLRELYLGRNRLVALPASLAKLDRLEVLDLEENLLTALPPELGNLPSLQELRLAGNPLREPPPEVVDQGASAILAYLRAALLEKSIEQWDSKLMLVGEGGVGKTCLLQALRGEPFDPQSETTHGMEIRHLALPHPERPGVEMTLRCWDFGGQQIYHATHQFFLTNRSLFLLAWNARIGFEQSKLYSWLDRIHALAPESPVLLVGTHLDEREADLPLENLRRKYPNIGGHYGVSSKSGEGIKELREAVRTAAAELPLMGERWPESWLATAEALRTLPERFVDLGAARALLARHGVESESRSVLLRWLHDLGDILFFDTDPELQNVVILDPEWVSQTISRVLENEAIIHGLGVFRRQHMEEVWHGLDRGLWEIFLRLMERFDLSYRIPDDPENKSLVVERLSLDPPDFAGTWDGILGTEGCRQIRMKFDLQSTVPPGVPTWFIARVHRFTTHTHWRYGALFTDVPEGRHLALVAAPPGDRCVTLTVRGPAPHGFFTLLRDGLELTLARFPGLDIRKTIPCPGAQGAGECGHEFDYAHLSRRLERVPPKVSIECPQCDTQVSVPELLFGLHWSTRDAILERIEELERANQGRERRILSGQRAVEAEIVSLRELTQRGFLVQLRAAQTHSESNCPCVFAVRPYRSAGWARLPELASQVWELQLYCEAPGQWHLTGEDGKYLVRNPAPWLEALGPHLRALVKLLKFAVPLAAPVLAYSALPDLNAVERDISLLKALLDRLPDQEEHPLMGTRSSKPAAPRTPERAEGASLRALHKLLVEIDPQRHWGGLQRVLTPEGHSLWLCERHSRDVEPPAGGPPS